MPDTKRLSPSVQEYQLLQPVLPPDDMFTNEGTPPLQVPVLSYNAPQDLTQTTRAQNYLNLKLKSN